MSNKGSLLLEAIIATGLAAVFGLALTQLVLVTSDATLRIQDRQEANYAAAQGVEALNTLDFANLSNVNNGHLVLTSGVWSTAAGSETLWNGMTRTVTVQSVSRDAGCFVVGSGGTVDPDSKLLASTVSWTDQTGAAKSITYSKHRTRYTDPQGSCFSDAASHLSLDTGTDKWTGAGNRQLHQLYINNTGADPITISHIAFTWTPATTISRIVLDATQVWFSGGGFGSPVGAQPSGTMLDVVDFTLAAGQRAEFTNVQFSNSMIGAVMTMSLTFTDGSVYVTPTTFTPN